MSKRSPVKETRPLLSRDEVAELLGIKPQTLAKWAHEGNFTLPMVKVGTRRMYRPDDVDAFIDRNLVTSGS